MGLQWSSFPSSRPLPEDCSSQDIQCFPSDVSHGRPLEDFGFMSKIAIRESYLLKTFFFFFSPVRSWAAFLKMWHTVDTLYNQILIALFFFVGEGGEVGKERRKEGKGRWCTHTHTNYDPGSGENRSHHWTSIFILWQQREPGLFTGHVKVDGFDSRLAQGPHCGWTSHYFRWASLTSFEVMRTCPDVK